MEHFLIALQEQINSLIKENTELRKQFHCVSNQIANLPELLKQTEPCQELRSKWLPRFDVMQFMGYADTQMNSIAKSYNFDVTEIGKRKFYGTDSVLKALEENRK